MAELIGTIVRLQVQAEPLKATGVYDPPYLVNSPRRSSSKPATKCS